LPVQWGLRSHRTQRRSHGRLGAPVL